MKIRNTEDKIKYAKALFFQQLDIEQNTEHWKIYNEKSEFEARKGHTKKLDKSKKILF